MDSELHRAINAAHMAMERARHATSYCAGISKKDGPIMTVLDAVTAALDQALVSLPEACRVETGGHIRRVEW